jgi:pimeloyl-ACP methyl ester carboxylesterase
MTAVDLHVVLVGGSFTEPDDFVRHGFVEALRARHPGCGVSLAAMRMAWFADESVVERLSAAVAAAGAARTWLAGISLGALASLCFVARSGIPVAGLVLMSPYPGTRLVQREIEQAGGLEAWSRHAQADDLERAAWLWLARRAPKAPPIFMYYGTQDRFAEGQRHIAAALPRDRVTEIEGGHDWPDWGTMWHLFLAEDALR